MSAPAAQGRARFFLDWGVVLQALFVAGVTAGGSMLITNIRLDGRITNLETQFKESTAEARVRQADYGPRMQKVEGENAAQNERITNLSASSQDQRRTNEEILTVLGRLREDVAAIKARLRITDDGTEAPRKR